MASDPLLPSRPVPTVPVALPATAIGFHLNEAVVSELHDFLENIRAGDSGTLRFLADTEGFSVQVGEHIGEHFLVSAEVRKAWDGDTQAAILGEIHW